MLFLYIEDISELIFRLIYFTVKSIQSGLPRNDDLIPIC